MTTPGVPAFRVGELRPNQLLHTYGPGAVADMPNLSVIVCGLDDWDPARGLLVNEDRLLAAIRRQLGPQVEALRLPPYMPETADPFGEWTRVGVPVWLFPRWLRCTDVRCNQLAPVESGLFELVGNAFSPDKIRYVHGCRGAGGGRPTAVPARFVLACERGHLDDFPWLFYAHGGVAPGPGDHTLVLREVGTTGDAASLWVSCSCGAKARSMAQAFGEAAPRNLPGCRGRNPHLRSFEGCGQETRTLGLGATNSWFAMRLRAFTLPQAEAEVDQRVAEHWGMLELLTGLPETQAKRLLVTQTCWPDLEPYGVDDVWKAIVRRAGQDERPSEVDELDLETPEWRAFTRPRAVTFPDFTTRREPPPATARRWLSEVVLVPRLRQVSALYGFTRIDAPEWDVAATDTARRAAISAEPPTWVPCAEMRGEGIFLRFDEDVLAAWERRPEVRGRRALLRRGHVMWRTQRGMNTGEWPGIRYVMLHTFAHALIRELALESGYSATGIAERVYSGTGAEPMAGVLLYTAAPDSEGTLGGLVSLGTGSRLGTLIEQALDHARLCSSDPLCSEHDPTSHGRLYGSACHACMFAAETSCERGNHYLDRALLIDTVTDPDTGFLAER